MKNPPWLESLYPDLARAGGLIGALRRELPALELEGSEPDHGLWSVGSTVGGRSAGASLGCEERAIVGGLREAGVGVGSFRTDSPAEVARIFEQWLIAGVPAARVSEAAAVPVEVDAAALAYEESTEAYVEYRWNELAESPWHPRIRELVAEAMRVPVLRALLPYTSHDDLHFSRSAGFPFSFDCPFIAPLKDGSFSVADAAGAIIGTGNAREAVALAAAHLPPGCGPAQRGPWPEPSEAESGDR